MLVVDTREHSLDELLKKFNVPFEKRKLDAGDYNIDDVILVERKTVADLYNSITQDGRFEYQPSELAISSDYPVVAVIGLPEQLAIHDINPNIIYGAIASIIVRHGINVWMFPNDVTFVQTLSKVNDKMAEGKFCARKNYWKTDIGSRVYFLSGIRGISGTTAYRLLQSFKSIKNIMNASIENLENVVGPINAYKIREFVDTEVKI